MENAHHHSATALQLKWKQSTTVPKIPPWD